MLRLAQNRTFVVTTLLLIFGAAATVRSQERITSDAVASTSSRPVVQNGMRATVGLSCKRGDYATYYGTGAVISADGYILTSTTVVPKQSEEIRVVFDGQVIRNAEIVETDDVTESTLLKVDGSGLVHFPVATELPVVGETAYTFSNANNIMSGGGRAAFSEGIVSGVYRVENIGGESTYAGPAIETTAAINPGSDGGPIVNQRGQLCAIVSLNVSPQRWMGVGVPVHDILSHLDVKQLRLDHESVATPSPSSTVWPAVAKDLSRFLVAIRVERKYAPEMLPRVPWDEYISGIENWEKKSTDEKTQTMALFSAVSRVLEVNQMLRRPAQLSAGVVISPDGYILTSAFNVGDDVVYRHKETKKMPQWKFTLDVEQLTKENKDLVSEKNEIEKIVVRLGDGSEHEAQLVARHALLGVALLKIDAQDLPSLDIAKSAAEPRLGERAGVIGMFGGDLTPYTLDTGIVSSPSRVRGFRFQTDALLNYGNSGGPVVTEDGHFLGIATEPIRPNTVSGRVFGQSDLVHWPVAPNSGVGMVGRADRILDALDELKAGTSVEGPHGAVLGVLLDPENAYANQAVVGGIAPNSPAKEAGLQKGDHIVEIDGQPLMSWGELTEAILSRSPGDKIQLKIQRKNIVHHLLINGQEVADQKSLDELMKKLKPGEKFEGELVQSDTKVITVTLGERK